MQAFIEGRDDIDAEEGEDEQEEGEAEQEEDGNADEGSDKEGALGQKRLNKANGKAPAAKRFKED